MRGRRHAAAALLAGMLAASGAFAQVIDSLDAVGPYLDLCVTRELRAQGFGLPRDVTLRLSFRRDGAIIGQPMVTYSRPTRGEPEQERFIGLMTAAFKSCTPLPFSNALGAAIAGKIFTFRYTLTNAKDQPI
jgi:hypothetical protein